MVTPQNDRWDDTTPEPDYMRDSAVYVISVAAELAGMHPQTLRQYDRIGLVTPRRTRGRGRRYSPRDIEQLKEVQRLSQDEGINLAGVQQILRLQQENERLRGENRRLKRLLVQAQRIIDTVRQRRERTFTASATGDVTTYRMSTAPRGRSSGEIILMNEGVRGASREIVPHVYPPTRW